jgi:TonB family protein
MMNKTTAAALLLSPLTLLVLPTAQLHGQAIAPAQFQEIQTAPVLQSSLIQPKGIRLAAAAAAAVPDAKTGAVRVSTGVVAPKLVKTVNIQEETVGVSGVSSAEREVVVAMVVDETGKPTDLKIVQSSDALLDQHVLAAVQQYRWQPGTVSGQIVAVPVNLHIKVREPGR